MFYTGRLIKNVAFDIIMVITVWGLLNNLKKDVQFYDKIYNIYTMRSIIGFSVSAYILCKYV